MSHFPSHYSEQDCKQIDTTLQWMDNHHYTQAALARLARVSSSSLNQIIKGSYITSPTKLLKSIAQAMQTATDRAAGNPPTHPVETSVYKLTQSACAMARRYRNFAVLSAYVGTGKTCALKHYARTHPNTHLIEATPTMTPASLVKLLAQEIAGYGGKGSIDDRYREVISTLKDTDSLLIVDEAETLTAHQLHTLRRLRDLAGVGIVLAGTEHLTGILKPEHGQFCQIRSRCGFWPATITAISQDDAVALISNQFGSEIVAEDVHQRLYQYSKGSARMLVEGLIAGIKEFRQGRELDVPLVDAVARQALCLQSVA